VQRVRHELKRREVTVARAEQLSPGFRAITFTSPALADFVSASFDDHVKLFLPAGGELVGRDYTPRRWQPGGTELTIEFALHGHGPASEWARQAAPGQPAVIGGPRGSFVVPLDYDWHLLAGDASALPAIHRRLEELPAGSRAIVRIHADPADRRTFPSAATLDLQWVDSADALVQAVRAVALPAGEGYAWCAGEASSMAALRDAVLVDKRHPKEAARIAAYWKRGASAHHQDLE
jgi:NADPH-dependent ferric siderophore reductase